MALWGNTKKSAAELMSTPVLALAEQRSDNSGSNSGAAEIIDLSKRRPAAADEPADRKVRIAVPRGVILKGSLTFDSSARIDGEFHGNISCGGTLLISEHANVSDAVIFADTIVIRGNVRASLQARKRIEIAAMAHFEGPLSAPSLKMEEGAVLSSTALLLQSAA